jgi:hypothetical protein
MDTASTFSGRVRALVSREGEGQGKTFCLQTYIFMDNPTATGLYIETQKAPQTVFKILCH